MSTRFDAAYTWTADVLASLRHSLSRGKFDEILPAILSDRYEPGARHSIAVLGDRTRPQVSKGPDGVVVRGAEFYYLPVSHCVEKQLSLEYLDRVYCVAPCVRLLMAGEDISGGIFTASSRLRLSGRRMMPTMSIPPSRSSCGISPQISWHGAARAAKCPRKPSAGLLSSAGSHMSDCHSPRRASASNMSGAQAIPMQPAISPIPRRPHCPMRPMHRSG